MAGVWMGFMLIVLACWAAWLNDYDELTHPKSEKRAQVSAALVAMIGMISLVVCISLDGGGSA